MACAGTSQMSAALNQIYGDTVNKKFQLKGSKVLIGRNPRADIKLENLSVSRKHCILTYTNKGWEIRDNNSQNGTWVSGQRLKPNESRLLDCGDIIFLGPPAELPQTFCFDIDYNSENQTELPVIRTSNETRLDDSVEDLKNILPKKTPEKGTSFNSSDAEIIVISPEKSSPSKENSCVINSPDLLTQASSKDCIYKRKLPTTSEPQIPSSSCSESKKSKCIQSIPNDFQVSTADNFHEANLGDQINEISSTENDQVEVSQSLLDAEDEKMSDQSCQNETESEKEVLKSKLTSMAAEIEKLRNERLAFATKYKSAFKKNDELQKQLAEQQQIKMDLQNCEQKAKNEIKKVIMEKFEEDLMCNICTELLIKPTVLECSHTFCEYCIHEWKKKKNECPMCRKIIKSMTRVLTLDHLIDKTLETLTPDQKVKREELIKERLMAEQQKKVQKSPGHPRYGRRAQRRRASFRNRAQPNVEVPQRRNLLLPIQLPPLAYPLQIPSITFRNSNFRIPEVVISDNEMNDSVYYVP